MKTIEGQFVGPNNAPIANGTLLLQLSQDAFATSGAGQIASRLPVVISLDAEGNIPAGTQLFGNDELTPAGTYYTATVTSPTFGQVYGPEEWSLVGDSPINVNDL